MYKKLMKVSDLNTLCTGHGDHSNFSPWWSCRGWGKLNF